MISFLEDQYAFKEGSTFKRIMEMHYISKILQNVCAVRNDDVSRGQQNK